LGAIPPPADASVWKSTLDFFKRTAKTSFQQMATRAAVAAMNEAGARKGYVKGASA
jgi:hypothetical protein